MVETLYEVLGSSPTAKQEELRSAYRDLARRYHPDVSDVPKDLAAKMFIAVQEAYDVLQDPLKRALYDSALAARAGGGLWGTTNRKPVTSSNLKSVGYDEQQKVLEVEFRDGSVYQYFAVPLATYAGLMRAQSKGRFLQQYVAPRFPYQRVG